MSLDRLVSCFPLCGRGAIVGGLRTAGVFTVFDVVVLMWPVAVFGPLATPPTLIWHDLHGSSFSLLARGSL